MKIWPITWVVMSFVLGASMADAWRNVHAMGCDNPSGTPSRGCPRWEEPFDDGHGNVLPDLPANPCGERK